MTGTRMLPKKLFHGILAEAMLWFYYEETERVRERVRDRVTNGVTNGVIEVCLCVC